MPGIPEAQNVRTRSDSFPWDRVSAALHEIPELRLAVAFGSVASGRATPRSDLDLAVAGPGPITWEQRAAWEGIVATAAGREVDLVDLRSAHGLILREILTRGRLLVCRDRQLYAAFIQRLWAELADFQPQLDRLIRKRVRRWIPK